MSSSHHSLVDDCDRHIGAPQPPVGEAARTAVSCLLCRLVDGKPWFSVQIAIARAEVLAVSLELGGYYDSHVIEGVPAVATPGITISGGGDVVRVDVRIAALKAELALVEAIARVVLFGIAA